MFTRRAGTGLSSTLPTAIAPGEAEGEVGIAQAAARGDHEHKADLVGSFPGAATTLANAIMRWTDGDGILVKIIADPRPLIDDEGIITNLGQPSVLIGNSSGESNVTGDATQATVVWNNEFRDNGNNMSSNTFTAPVDGMYLFIATVNLVGLLAAHTRSQLGFITTDRTYSRDGGDVGAMADSDGEYALHNSVVAEMDANDTCTVQVTVHNGTKVVDFKAANGFFSAVLLN